MKLLKLSLNVFFAFGLSSSLFAVNPNGSGPDAAAEQLKKLKVHDKLKVSLFASEPMVVNPANISIDHKGRVWSTEGANYRLWQKWGKLRPGGDRIVILEDTDGDGAADKQKVFYQGDDVNTALGIVVLGNKVIVSCSPNVLVFTDEDGDDKPDKKEVLFSNIKGVDHDHGVHAFVFGPDGKLYFNQGNNGYQVGNADGEIVTDIYGRKVIGNRQPFQQGMVFRCNMDGSQFEVLGHNFRNNYEVAVDSFGTLWQSDNDDDGNRGVRINYVMQQGNYGYRSELNGAGWRAKRANLEKEISLQHWHLNDPGVVPNLLQTGAGSPTGILHYEGTSLPLIFRNQVIHCDAGPGVVRAYIRKDNGAGYSARIVNILEQGEDRWFRPSDVCAAPDGSLFISDWNDANVGGHYMADQKLESLSGRIYRVTAKQSKYEVPKHHFEKPAQAIKALKSPNMETRYLAWSALNAMGEKSEPALNKLFENGKNQSFRARAFHLLVQTPASEKYIVKGLKDPNKDIRILAIRTAKQKVKDIVSLIRPLTFDPSSQVRRECALALFQVKGEESAKMWADLASQHIGSDRWYLEALGIAATDNEDACFKAYEANHADKLTTPGGKDIIWRSRSEHAIDHLIGILKDKQLPQDQKQRYYRSLDFHEGPKKEAALLDLLTLN